MHRVSKLQRTPAACRGCIPCTKHFDTSPLDFTLLAGRFMAVGDTRPSFSTCRMLLRSSLRTLLVTAVRLRLLLSFRWELTQVAGPPASTHASPECAEPQHFQLTPVRRRFIQNSGTLGEPGKDLFCCRRIHIYMCKTTGKTTHMTRAAGIGYCAQHHGNSRHFSRQPA